jgi:hypothetical protein
MEVNTVGLDLGKRVFQVHGVDAAGRVMVRTKAAAGGGGRVLQGPAALSGGHGGLRDGASPSSPTAL